MMIDSYSTSIIVPQSKKSAFEAIKNIKAWWSEDIEGPTDILNESFLYKYKDVHLSKIRLITIIPETKLVYLVEHNRFSFTTNKAEWTGTHLVFDVTEHDHQTKITFTHEGLVPEYECYEICNEAWTNYIQKSLFSLVTTGKGIPNPINKDGFNAEIVEKWKLDT